MKQINISITQVCAFQSMKSLDDGTARHDSNDLLGTVGEFSLPQSYTDASSLLKRYKKWFCALPTSNILKEIWCELMLKDYQNEAVSWTEKFCQVKLWLKTYGVRIMKNKNVCQTLHSGIISFLLYQKMSYIYLTYNIISQNSALVKQTSWILSKSEFGSINMCP